MATGRGRCRPPPSPRAARRRRRSRARTARPRWRAGLPPPPGTAMHGRWAGRRAGPGRPVARHAGPRRRTTRPCLQARRARGPGAARRHPSRGRPGARSIPQAGRRAMPRCPGNGAGRRRRRHRCPAASPRTSRAAPRGRPPRRRPPRWPRVARRRRACPVHQTSRQPPCQPRHQGTTPGILAHRPCRNARGIRGRVPPATIRLRGGPPRRRASPRWSLARPAGLEPATYSLEGCCSIQLS